jgi:hypothetical protein
MDDDALHSIEVIRGLVDAAVVSNNLEYLVHIIHKGLQEYVEVSMLATDGEYESSWTHNDVLNYITYGEKNGS